MKKILFTIQWYPSVLSANALCDQKIIERLSSDNQYDITCLVYKPIGASAKAKIGNVNIIRFHKGAWWNIKIQAKEKNGKLSKVILALDKIFLRIRQIITIPIYPVMEPISNWRFAHKALKLHKEKQFDMVISEYHGLDSLHAGSTLKKKYPNIIFLPILWDAFTGKEPAKYLPSRYANWRMKQTEAYELSCADKIIAMKSSRKYHEQYSKGKTYYDRFIYLDIPGIIKRIKTSHTSTLIHKGKINIIYTGILSLPDRDPEYIIQALTHTSFASNIHLLFICIGDGRQKLEMLKRQCPCEITISGYIDKEELVSVYYGADVLLNLGGPNPNMVPSKVFEYLSYGKPILSTYYVNNEASLEYMEKYPLSVCVDQRKPLIDAKKLLENKLFPMIGNSIPYETIQQLFPENTPDRYKKIIDEFLSN